MMLNELNIEISAAAQAVIDKNANLEDDLMISVDIKDGALIVDLFCALEKSSNELHNVESMACGINHLIA